MLSRIKLGGSAAGLTVFMLVAANATGHHSFAPHFDSGRKVNISGTVTAYEARNPPQLPPHQCCG